MKAKDIVVGALYIDAVSAKRSDGQVVTVLATTTRNTPCAGWTLDYAPGYRRAQSQTPDPYWRGAPEQTVCVQYENGQIAWTHSRYIVRPA
jgi:hypothetical protein